MPRNSPIHTRLTASRESAKNHVPSGTKKVIAFPMQRSLADQAWSRWADGETPKEISRSLRVGENFINQTVHSRVFPKNKVAA